MSSALIAALHSRGPHPDAADQLRLFGQFVGSWDVEVVNYGSDGRRHVMPGEWHFGWALDGRAILDVWIAPRRGEPAPEDPPLGDYGATLRFYDDGLARSFARR